MIKRIAALVVAAVFIAGTVPAFAKNEGKGPTPSKSAYEHANENARFLRTEAAAKDKEAMKAQKQAEAEARKTAKEAEKAKKETEKEARKAAKQAEKEAKEKQKELDKQARKMGKGLGR